MRERALVVHSHAVDMDGARLDLLGEPQTPSEILGKDGRGETVLGVIGDPESLLVRLDLVQRHRGAEALRLVDFGIGSDAADDNGAHARLGALLGG